MARRQFEVIDVVEVLQHWHAGRPKSVVASSLGVDPKTVRKYVAKAVDAGLVPGGPVLGREEWAELVRGWFPELVDAKARSLTSRRLPARVRIRALLPLGRYRRELHRCKPSRGDDLLMTEPVLEQVTMYETRQVQAVLAEWGAHLERETLSTFSDNLGLITRPPGNDRRPRRWTMAQIEFIAAATRFTKMRGTEPVAALASGDSTQILRYVEEVQAWAEQLIERAPAAHDETIAAIHSLRASLEEQARLIVLAPSIPISDPRSRRPIHDVRGARREGVSA